LPALNLAELLRQHGTHAVFGGLPEKRIGFPQICWIPDFQHVHRPDFFSVEERRSRDTYFARMMVEADRVVVSNQCSWADAVELFPQHEHKLAVVPFTMFLGSKWRTDDTAAVVRKYGLPEKFLLLPGQFWKHKNHATVFRSIQLLRERGVGDVVLACTGSPHDYRFPRHANDLRRLLAEDRLERAVRILGLLPRGDQVQLMRAAAAVVQPSFFEGWSAVLEECRSMGKIIFASDIPMHREQLTEGVHLFDPNSAEALADLIARHWPNLRPGPDASLESAAENVYHARLSEFARSFIRVCSEAASPAHSR
jgi:glycosyltransferase involved in cell wall biosynthesis